MPISVQHCAACSSFRRAGRPNEVFARFRKSTPPPNGWTQQAFQTGQGRRLVKDVMAVRRLAMREVAPKLTKALLSMFEDELEQVLTTFAMLVKRNQGKALTTVVLTLNVPDGAEGLWLNALDTVFKDGSVKGRVMGVFRPSYQSVMSHVVNKTNVLIPPPAKPELVEPPSVRPAKPDLPMISVSPDWLPQREPLTRAKMNDLITAKADNLCNQVTRISETTRNRMRNIFNDKIKAGATVGDVIKTMKEAFPRIARNRIPTIVRTELGRAANEAQILSFQNSPTLTHCSVMGCEAVEMDGPHYKGFPTCNIRNVPVDELENVEFHINHTGCWVPSGFRNDDGSVPRLRLGNDPGIGAWDDPNAPRHRPSQSR